jgi:hypothetical protein
MYIIEATGEKMTSFFKACESASAHSCNIIEEETGLVRWTPAPAVDAKKIRAYNNRKHVYAVSQQVFANRNKSE